jgi:hypothetical protein
MAGTTAPTTHAHPKQNMRPRKHKQAQVHSRTQQANNQAHSGVQNLKGSKAFEFEMFEEKRAKKRSQATRAEAVFAVANKLYMPALPLCFSIRGGHAAAISGACTSRQLVQKWKDGESDGSRFR